MNTKRYDVRKCDSIFGAYFCINDGYEGVNFEHYYTEAEAIVIAYDMNYKFENRETEPVEEDRFARYEVLHVAAYYTILDKQIDDTFGHFYTDNEARKTANKLNHDEFEVLEGIEASNV